MKQKMNKKNNREIFRFLLKFVFLIFILSLFRSLDDLCLLESGYACNLFSSLKWNVNQLQFKTQLKLSTIVSLNLFVRQFFFPVAFQFVLIHTRNAHTFQANQFEIFIRIASSYIYHYILSLKRKSNCFIVH